MLLLLLLKNFPALENIQFCKSVRYTHPNTFVFALGKFLKIIMNYKRYLGLCNPEDLENAYTIVFSDGEEELKYWK